jgi:hypothetical protein
LPNCFGLFEIGVKRGSVEGTPHPRQFAWFVDGAHGLNIHFFWTLAPQTS